MGTKKTSKILFCNIHLAGFAAFLLLLLYFHRYVYMGADDFFYANFWGNGLRGFVKLNIEHYENLTGRTFVHLLCETVLSLGMTAFGLVNTLFIGFTVFYSAKIASYDTIKGLAYDRFKFTLLSCLFLFLSLDIMILREGVFWVSGSYNYLFPAMLQVLYFYFLSRDLERQGRNKLLFILSFLSGATVEQTGIVVILTNMFLIVTYYIKNRKIPHSIYFLNFLAGIAGYMTLFLSPGVSQRLSQHGSFSSLPLFSKIAANLPLVSRMVIGENGIGILLALILVFAAAFLFKQKKLNKQFVLLWVLFGLSILMLLLVSLQIIISEYAVILTLFLAVLSLVFIILYTFAGGEYTISFFIAVGLATTAVMLVSPVLGMRMVFAGALFFIIALSRLAAKVKLRLNILLIILFIFSVISFADYFDGYRKNSPVLEENLRRTREFKAMGGTHLSLVSMNDENYGYENIPVATNFVDSFKLLYALPQDTIITVEDPSERPIRLMNRIISAKSVVRKDTIYIPVRAFFQDIGYSVAWEDSCAVAEFNSKKYYFKPGSSVVVIKTESGTDIKKLKAPVRSIHSSVYFPSDFIEKVLSGNISINRGELQIALNREN